MANYRKSTPEEIKAVEDEVWKALTLNALFHEELILIAEKSLQRIKDMPVLKAEPA